MSLLHNHAFEIPCLRLYAQINKLGAKYLGLKIKPT